MYDGYSENPEKGTTPERDKADAKVRCEDVDDPMRGQRCDTKDDEKGDEVGALRADLCGPTLEPGLEGGKGEECRTKSSGDEVAERCACGDARTGQRQGPGHTPHSAAKDGKVH